MFEERRNVMSVVIIHDAKGNVTGATVQNSNVDKAIAESRKVSAMLAPAPRVKRVVRRAKKVADATTVATTQTPAA
jgi:hypothetical protein